MGEYRLKIGDFALTGASWHKISGRRGCPTNHSSSQKTRLNDLSYGINIWIDLYFILSQCTRLTDGRTDSCLIAIPRLHSMQRGKNVVGSIELVNAVLEKPVLYINWLKNKFVTKKWKKMP